MTDETMTELRILLCTLVLLAVGAGPAQVASTSYRDGYDRVFGGRQEVGQA